jgi:4-hydroxy-tetrahydrodipicolinate reductase
MKVALIGYGKMGHIIEQKLLERGHTVVARFNSQGIDLSELKKAEIAIEFSKPESAFNNIKTSLEAGIATVSGTTGWLKYYPEITALSQSRKVGFLYASNFSLGVNLFFALNKKLAGLMSSYPSYQASLTEVHHLQKLDAPSGTGITLAEQILAENSQYKKWELKENAQKDDLSIEALREENVPGTHIINYDSPIDSISIKHTAHSREGFALGAVLAAEYLIDKTGVCTMQDVLNLNE